MRWLCVICLWTSGPVVADDVTRPVSRGTPQPEIDFVLSDQPLTASRDLTPQEISDFVGAMSACWISPEGAPTVVVGFSMTIEGRVDPETFALVSVSPEGADAGDAFAAVRQGVLRCQGDGYDLPRAAYDQWRDLEITFAPDVAGAD